MKKKMTSKDLDRLILETLQEVEYVTGSKMPKAKGDFDFGSPWFMGTVRTTTDFKKSVKSLVDFCNRAGDFRKSKTGIGDQFKRMMAVEMLHKFLKHSIPSSGDMGFAVKQTGFAMETQIVNLFGGKIISGELNDIYFPSDTNSSYSLKFLASHTAKLFGVKQKPKMLQKWLETNKQKINYVVFIKIGDTEDSKTVGVDVRYFEVSRKEAQRLFDDHKEKVSQAAVKRARERAAEKSGQEKSDSKDKAEILKMEDNIIFFRGEYTDLQSLGVIELPRDISDLMKISFQEIDNKIKNLYASLDDFKENLTAYYTNNQTTGEREKTLKSFTVLEKNKNDAFNEGQKTMTFSENTQNKKNISKKSKKDLDKLIQEVILNKNK